MTQSIGGWVLFSTLASHGAVLYDENGPMGDLSDDYLMPDILTVGLGENEIIGSLTNEPGERDFFTLRVPAGMQIFSFRILAYSGGGLSGSFLGMVPGSTLGASPEEFIARQFDLFRPPINTLIFDDGFIDDGDFLPQLVVGAPLDGGNPLPAGDYAVWLNETSNEGATFNISFGVTAVPEPGSALLAALGLVELMRRRRLR